MHCILFESDHCQLAVRAGDQIVWAKIDDGDAAWALAQHWHLASHGYPQTNIKVDGKWVRRLLHRLVLPGHPMLDHINGDRLDARLSNLRPATRAQNQWNRGKQPGARWSQHKGVTFNPKKGLWRATIIANRRKHYLGYFRTEAGAARAYREAARELHGEFARLS